MDDAETDSCSALLGGEERLENLTEKFRRHALSGVGDYDPDGRVVDVLGGDADDAA